MSTENNKQNAQTPQSAENAEAAEVEEKEKFWHCGQFRFSLSRPLVMGVLNVTPDSFSDGGDFADAKTAVAHGLWMAENGADIVDVGGESTRPGAQPVSAEEEKRRILPVIEKLAAQGLAVSADTMKPPVMRAALEHGAAALNDVKGFRAEDAVKVAGECKTGCGLVVMHMRGEPKTMQVNPYYERVVSQVKFFLRERAEALEAAGVAPERICVDPGIGFGKTTAHNLALLSNFRRLTGWLWTGGRAYPMMLGASRKSLLGELTGRQDPKTRDTAGAVLAALMVVLRHAWGIRTHDPAGVRDALTLAIALRDAPDRLPEPMKTEETEQQLEEAAKTNEAAKPDEPAEADAPVKTSPQ